MELIIIAIVYVLAVIVITRQSMYYEISQFKVFLISVFLTPLIGALFVFNSKRKIMYKVKQYKCPSCNFSFTEQHEYCPHCIKENKKVRLQEKLRDMT